MTPQIRLDLDTVIDIYASSKLCLDKLPEPVKQIIRIKLLRCDSLSSL